MADDVTCIRDSKFTLARESSDYTVLTRFKFIIPDTSNIISLLLSQNLWMHPVVPPNLKESSNTTIWCYLTIPGLARALFCGLSAESAMHKISKSWSQNAVCLLDDEAPCLAKEKQWEAHSSFLLAGRLTWTQSDVHPHKSCLCLLNHSILLRAVLFWIKSLSMATFRGAYVIDWDADSIICNRFVKG